jgi:hypothetical protein
MNLMDSDIHLEVCFVTSMLIDCIDPECILTVHCYVESILRAAGTFNKEACVLR